MVAPRQRTVGLPLLIVLHGCWVNRTQRDIADCVNAYYQMAEEANVVVMVPWAQTHTWDFVASQGQQGTDTSALSFAIEEAYRIYGIDTNRIAVMGFSDGASFGLSLVLANPVLFEAALVWATGFVLPAPLAKLDRHLERDPRIFMWHGTNDQIFDFRSTALPLRDVLLKAGYELDYRAEDGGRHICPQPGSVFCHEALRFWLDISRRA